MKSTIRVISFLTLMLFLLHEATDAYASGPNTEVDLDIRVYSYPEEVSLSGAQIILDVNPGTLSFQVPENDYHYVFDQSIDVEGEIENIEITLAPPPEYLGRRLPLRPQKTETGEKSFSRRIHIYSLQRDFKIPRHFQGEIRKALENGEIDSSQIEKALALSEYANRLVLEREEATPNKVIVFYNYARALKDACITPRLSYDTCSLARGIFEKLSGWYESHKDRLTKDTGVTEEMVDRAIEDINTHNQKEAYAEVVDAYNRGVILGSTEGYGEAARMLGEFIETYSDNEVLWAKNRVTKEALYRDAGLSWLSYGIGLFKNPELADDEPLELSEIFKTSQNFLEQALELGEQSPNTIEGLDLARQWEVTVSTQPGFE